MNRYWKIRLELFSRRRTWILALMGFGVLLCLLYIRYAANADIDHDEVEHAHAAFKILNKEIPYRDFYQNHMPAYWLLGMQFVRAFPFSIDAILAARFLNLLILAGCWLFGLRLLGCVRGGRTWFGLSVYTCAMITLACETSFHETRPDPVMVLIGTMGLCLIPARGYISSIRALLLGILFGLAISVSPKILPIVLVVPVLIIFHCMRDRRVEPIQALFTYGLGVLLGLLPLAFFIFHNGILDKFLFDVVQLNAAISKSWYRSFFIFRIPICIMSVLGTVVLFWRFGRRFNRLANGPLVMLLALAAGLALAFIARHTGRYNMQILIVPMAVGAVSLILHLCLRRRLSYQLLLCAALLGYPVFSIANALGGLTTDYSAVSQRKIQAIMDLAKPGNRTCTAFAPTHPVFCHDVSELSNGWDLGFVERIKNQEQLERFRRLWHDGIQNTLNYKPDIILRRSPDNIWERAEEEGLITIDELNALDAIRSDYEIRDIGSCEIWIRESGE